MRILLFGSSGQVGRELQRALAPIGQVLGFDRRSADFEHVEQIIKAVTSTEPDIIVNAAAYTAVERAEDEIERAYAINAHAVEALAQQAARRGIWFIHYSTDYVFDGHKVEPYTEDDIANPLNVYGASKLAGEKALQRSGARHLILRSSWIYSAHGRNFAKTVLQLASEQTELRVVADQIGAPSGADLIADVTATILSRLFSDPRPDPVLAGIYHLTAAGQTSWHGFAQAVLTEGIAAGARLRASAENVAAIKSVDYPTKARRPTSSRLATEKLHRTFNVHAPDWRQGVRRVVREILARERA